MTTASAPGSVQRGGGRLASFAGRVKNVLVRPRDEWHVIAAEPTTERDLYLG